MLKALNAVNFTLITKYASAGATVVHKIHFECKLELIKH